MSLVNLINGLIGSQTSSSQLKFLIICLNVDFSMDMFLFAQRKQKLELELLQTKPGQLELPKLRKVVREEEKVEEKKKDEVKKKVVKKVKKKESDYELPEIADYERPALEKYEKSDFDPNRRVSFLFVC